MKKAQERLISPGRTQLQTMDTTASSPFTLAPIVMHSFISFLLARSKCAAFLRLCGQCFKCGLHGPLPSESSD